MLDELRLSVDTLVWRGTLLLLGSLLNHRSTGLLYHLSFTRRSVLSALYGGGLACAVYCRRCDAASYDPAKSFPLIDEISFFLTISARPCNTYNGSSPNPRLGLSRLEFRVHVSSRRMSSSCSVCCTLRNLQMLKYGRPALPSSGPGSTSSLQRSRFRLARPLAHHLDRTLVWS